MKKNSEVSPVLKWVGGKRQLLSALTALLPAQIPSYCEPFVGGGALLFSLQPTKAWINDINQELINVYEVLKNDVDALIEELEKHKNEANYFYKIRNWDRDKTYYGHLSPVQRAARVLYLNKTCYNGLFRVNSAGEFNTPFGHYKNPNIVNASMLKAVHTYFNTASIQFSSVDYANLLDHIDKNTFVYLDPPYDPVSDTANFTGYAKGGFDKSEQLRLRDFCHELNRRNIPFMLSNSATDFIRSIYADYNLTIIQAKRAINSVASKRGEVDEIVVRNYE